MEKTIHSAEGEKLRVWLCDRRIENGLTMREVASRLDEPHQFVAKVEYGERRLDVVEFVAYCRALDVDPAEGLAVVTG